MPVLHRPRWESFAQAIVLGTAINEAYLQAGYNAKNKASALSAGNKLLHNNLVRARVTELQEAQRDSCIMDIEERFDILRTIARDPKQSSNDRMGAIKLINQMTAPPKVKVSETRTTPDGEQSVTTTATGTCMDSTKFQAAYQLNKSRLHNTTDQLPESTETPQ